MPAPSWNPLTTAVQHLPTTPASASDDSTADHPPLDDRHLYGHPRSTKGFNMYHHNHNNGLGYAEHTMARHQQQQQHHHHHRRNQSPHSVFGFVNPVSSADSVNAIFSIANQNGAESIGGGARNQQANGIGAARHASNDPSSAMNGAPLPEVRNSSATMNNILSPNGHVVHSTTNHNSSSANKISPVRADFYWFAQGGDSPHVDNYVVKQVMMDHGVNVETDAAGAGASGTMSEMPQLDRDERIRVLRERQAEERQRRLDELRNAAVSAQKFREIQEEDRRRKIEEIRWRDTERRHLVEERKRQIWEAEKERRETILRKSQERETRIEAKRNAQRNSIGFAFGSCTPRMLDLDMSSSSSASVAGTSGSSMAGRRSNSQSNVLGGTTMTLSRAESVDTQDGETHHGSNLDHRRSNSVNHRHTIHEALFWENYSTSDSHPLSAPNVQSVSVLTAPWGITEHTKSPLTTTSTKPNPNSHSSLIAGCREPPYGNLCGSAVLVGGDDLMTQSLTSLASSTPFRRGRRRTDLVPTIPMTSSVHTQQSPSSSQTTSAVTTSRTRSPGRAYSMTRLDQLATPRKLRPLEALQEGFKQGVGGGGTKKKITPAKSMIQLACRSKGRGAGRSSSAVDQRSLSKSKSTSHLGPRDRSSNRSSAATTTMTTTNGGSPPNLMSHSMWHLTPRVAGGPHQPRPTRTSILRRESGNVALRDQGNGRSSAPRRNPPKSGGSASGENSETDTSSLRAPSSPSRPQSSMSQQSLSSQNSSVSLRARSTQSAPRRPRPLSVAGSQPARPSVDERRGRSVEKRMPLVSSSVNSKPPPRAKSVGATQLLDGHGQPAALKVAPVPAKRRPPPPPPPPPKKQATSTPTPEKPKIPPKPNLRKPADIKTPVVVAESEPVDLQFRSNSEEHAPPVPQEPLSNGSESPSEAEDVSTVSSDATSVQDVRETVSSETPTIDVAVTAAADVIQPSDAVSEKQKPVLAEIPQKEIDEVKDALQQTVLEDDSSTGTPMPKPRITTEEEAKAAMAEKRRLAREQAEREAELERQRQEQLRREEEERLRREEEEQREWELEQERSRQAEQERLRRAIEEQEQREEEERQRREEETKQKEEKERAERIAREEQEKARKENEEKLRREEEERAQRRRRVEAIMSRTRGGKAGGTNTPPPSSSSSKNMDQTSAMFSEEQEQQMMDVVAVEAGDDDDDDDNNVHQNGILSQETSPTEEEEEEVVVGVRTNGFSANAQIDIQVVDGRGNPSKKSSPLAATNDDNGIVSPAASPRNHQQQLLQDHQLIDLTVVGVENPTMVVVSTSSSTKGGGLGGEQQVVHHLHHLNNEDSVNFNITRNGLVDDSSFVVDNYANNARQETTMTDMLS